METEQEILSSVRAGDRKAMHRLYERLAGRATAVAMRYLADREEVKDVLQDSFVKVFTQIGRFDYRGEGSLQAWAMRIVAHEAVDSLRSRRRLQTLVSADDEAVERAVEVTMEEPDVGAVSDERLFQLIAALPDGYRTVLNLYVFERMSHQEIGRLLGIKAVTSASQFLRAKRMLATMIDNHQNQRTR